MNRPPAPSRRRWFVLVSAALVASSGLGAVWHQGGSADPATRPAPQPAATGYRIEQGVVAWRPMRFRDQVLVAVLTFGLASQSEAVTGQILPRADAASFRALGQDHGRDKARVWYQAEEIVGADPQSFAALGFGLSHDRAQVWQGATPVLALDPAQAGPVRAHSGRILSVGATTWFLGPPPHPLAEAPRAPPIHHCRDWFTMNDALWEGARKVLPLVAPSAVIDCDGGIRTRFEGGRPVEDISGNKGLLLRSGAEVWRLRLGAEPERVAALPEAIAQTLLMQTGDDDVLLVRSVSGAVHALALRPQAPLQGLGRFAALPESGAVVLGRGLWLGDHYVTLAQAPGPADPVVTDHGPSRQLGEMALVGGALYYGDAVIARPGNLPLRQIAPATLLVGPSCLNFGNFVSDVPDPAADRAEIVPLCDTMHPPPTVLYEGLRIGFSPQPRPLGPDPELPGLTRHHLGEMVVENTTDAAIDVPAGFLKGLVLEVARSDITPPEGALPTGGLHLAPGARQVWPLEASSTEDPRDWGWVLYLRHSPARARVFGPERVAIGHGGFGG